MEGFREKISSFTMEELHAIRSCLGLNFSRGKKPALVSAILSFLSFGGSEEQFLQWFATLPPYLAMAITETTFTEFIDAEGVSESAGKPLVVESLFYYGDHAIINPNLRLGLFNLYSRYGMLLLYMKPLFRSIFARLLPKPKSFPIGPCEEQEHTPWSAADTLSESMPLLLKSLHQLMEDPLRNDKIHRRGLNKGDIRELRKGSAFPVFTLGADQGADPIDLIVRFMLIDQNNFSYSPKEDVRDFLKTLVESFFTLSESGTIPGTYIRLDSSYELTVLSPHLAKIPGKSRYDSNMRPFPVSRNIFHQLMSIMARAGSWFNIEEVMHSISMQNLPFFILGKHQSNPEMVLKGEELVLPEGRIHADEWERGFPVDWYLKDALISRPLLKGYCYLMAAFGLLEIAEVEPEKPLKKRGKMVPISSFDCLGYARITPFGAWCLGISEEKPELEKVSYEAIADRELPLVTYRGRSLECKVYLKRIGDPVGEERFRISEASFIRDCKSMDEILSRIDDFHRLVTSEPATHWKELFSRVRERAELFRDPKPCFMIQLRADKELRRLFLEDKEISSLVSRAEGGQIVVEEKHYRKLRKALKAYGFLNSHE